MPTIGIIVTIILAAVCVDIAGRQLGFYAWGTPTARIVLRIGYMFAGFIITFIWFYWRR